MDLVVSVFVASVSALLLEIASMYLGALQARGQVLPYVVITFVSVAVVTRVALVKYVPRTTVWEILKRSAWVGVLGGTLTLWLLTFWFYANRNALPAGQVFELLGSLVVSMFGGMVLGPAVALPSGLVAMFARDRRRADGLDRVVFALSCLLALFATWVADREASGGHYGGWAGIAAMALAAVGLGWTLVCAVRHRRFLAAPPAPWSIDAASNEDALLRVFVSPGDDVLVHRAEGDGGPFRSTTTTTRYARLSRDRARAALGRRAAVAFVMLVGLPVWGRTTLQHKTAIALHQQRRPELHPTVVEGLPASRELAVTNDYACAVGTDGRVRCWGNDAGPHLGLERQAQWIALEVAGSPKTDRVVLSPSTVCVLDAAAGQPRCAASHQKTFEEASAFPPNTTHLVLDASPMALNADGRVAPGVTTAFDELGKLTDVVQITASSEHACALDRAGAVWCVGSDYNGAASGQDIRGPGPAHLQAVRVAGLPPAKRVVAAAGSTWARTDRGWYVWGGQRHDYDLFGGPQGPESVRPVAGTEHLADLVAAGGYTCGLFDDGSVTCFAAQWADSSERRVMDGLPPGSALQIAGSNTQLCARGKEDVKCWGPR